jgi:hypothetical protein
LFGLIRQDGGIANLRTKDASIEEISSRNSRSPIKEF